MSVCAPRCWAQDYLDTRVRHHSTWSLILVTLLPSQLCPVFILFKAFIIPAFVYMLVCGVRWVLFAWKKKTHVFIYSEHWTPDPLAYFGFFLLSGGISGMCLYTELCCDDTTSKHLCNLMVRRGRSSRVLKTLPSIPPKLLKILKYSCQEPLSKFLVGNTISYFIKCKK